MSAVRDAEYNRPPAGRPVTAERACSPAQQQLVNSCQGLVRSLAWKVQRKLPPHVELDDLIAFGQVGLVEAARDYDPSWGTRFITYAHYRVRGAILDGLSKMSWFSRYEYHSSRYEHLADEVLRLENEAPQGDGARSLAQEAGALARVVPAIAIVYLATGLDRDEGGGDIALADISSPSPPAAAMEHEIRDKLRRLIDALPADAGNLMRGVYYEGLTLQEAGDTLGISKAWASRLHAKTLQRLAHALRVLGYDE